VKSTVGNPKDLVKKQYEDTKQNVKDSFKIVGGILKGGFHEGISQIKDRWNATKESWNAVKDKCKAGYAAAK
jgi:hypothetical protein